MLMDVVLLSLLSIICSQCTLSLPPQGVKKGCIGNKWVNFIHETDGNGTLKWVKLSEPFSFVMLKKWPNILQKYYGIHNVRFLKFGQFSKLWMKGLQKTKFKSEIFFMPLRNACPANIYLLQVYNRKTRKKCEICSKLMIKTPERRNSRHGLYIWDIADIRLILNHNFLFIFRLGRRKYRKEVMLSAIRHHPHQHLPAQS